MSKAITSKEARNDIRESITELAAEMEFGQVSFTRVVRNVKDGTKLEERKPLSEFSPADWKKYEKSTSKKLRRIKEVLYAGGYEAWTIHGRDQFDPVYSRSVFEKLIVEDAARAYNPLLNEFFIEYARGGIAYGKQLQVSEATRAQGKSIEQSYYKAVHELLAQALSTPTDRAAEISIRILDNNQDLIDINYNNGAFLAATGQKHNTRMMEELLRRGADLSLEKAFGGLCAVKDEKRLRSLITRADGTLDVSYFNKGHGALLHHYSTNGVMVNVVQEAVKTGGIDEYPLLQTSVAIDQKLQDCKERQVDNKHKTFIQEVLKEKNGRITYRSDQGKKYTVKAEKIETEYADKEGKAYNQYQYCTIEVLQNIFNEGLDIEKNKEVAARKEALRAGMRSHKKNHDKNMTPVQMVEYYDSLIKQEVLSEVEQITGVSEEAVSSRASSWRSTSSKHTSREVETAVDTSATAIVVALLTSYKERGAENWAAVISHNSTFITMAKERIAGALAENGLMTVLEDNLIQSIALGWSEHSLYADGHDTVKYRDGMMEQITFNADDSLNVEDSIKFLDRYLASRDFQDVVQKQVQRDLVSQYDVDMEPISIEDLVSELGSYYNAGKGKERALPVPDIEVKVEDIIDNLSQRYSSKGSEKDWSWVNPLKPPRLPSGEFLSVSFEEEGKSTDNIIVSPPRVVKSVTPSEKGMESALLPLDLPLPPVPHVISVEPRPEISGDVDEITISAPRIVPKRMITGAVMSATLPPPLLPSFSHREGMTHTLPIPLPPKDFVCTATYDREASKTLPPPILPKPVNAAAYVTSLKNNGRANTHSDEGTKPRSFKKKLGHAARNPVDTIKQLQHPKQALKDFRALVQHNHGQQDNVVQCR